MVLRVDPEEIWTMSSLPKVSVGLLGLGTVGAEVLRLLADEAGKDWVQVADEMCRPLNGNHGMG